MAESSTPSEPMIQCPVCKSFLPAGSRFCPNDGTPLTETAALGSVPTPTSALPSLADMELPTVVGGRYRLVAVRGGGGMARVYQAIDQTLDREVAVKLINPQLRADPEFDARFQREARIASKLNDPHIVVVHDFGIDPAHGPFLVMEFLQGQSLREHLHSKGPLPFKAALQMAGQLFLALIHAHGQGIVHRDIKPDNLFLMNISGVRLHVRVLDFGIARIMNRDSAGNAQLTTPGAVLGTPRYMSPEQLAGLPLDARSDLYSAALVIYESLTGQLPHTRGTRVRALCPEVPQGFDDLLAQCLDSNPENRPSSALEAFLKLQEMGKASGVLLLPAGAMERLAEARRQTRERSSSQADTVPENGSALPARRGVVIGLLVLIGVAALLGVLRFLFSGALSGSTGSEEKVLGVQIGDEQQAVIDRLNLSQPGSLSTQEDGPVPGFLTRGLRTEDVRVDPRELPQLEARHTPDDHVWAVFHRGKVRALMVRDIPGVQGIREVGIGGSVSVMYDRYPEPATTFTVPVSPDKDPENRKNATVHVYPQRGIAFETYGSRIVAITLFPRQE